MTAASFLSNALPVLNIILLIAVIVTVLLFIIPNIIVIFLIHKKMFGSRFTPDPDVPTYTVEGVGVIKTPIEVELEGEMIRGGIYDPKDRETDPDILLVVCHGMWSSHMSYMQEIGYFCSAGFKVLSFDYIGAASSDGEKLGGFGQSLRSLNRIIEYIKETDGLSHRKIWVFGHSWGGYAATNLPKFQPDIEGIIAMSPASSFNDIILNVFPKFIVFFLPLVKWIDKRATGEFTGLNATNSLSDYKGKALFVHSKDDPMCLYSSSTAAIKKKYGDRFDYLIVNGKGHNPNYTLEGLAIAEEYNTKRKKLKKEEDKIKLKKETNFLAIGALDSSVMDVMVNFIRD